MLPIVLSYPKPLSQAELTTWLQQLRAHAYAPLSQFPVAVALEVKLDRYYYFGGVNVESKYHNRLSIHAEQSALSALVTGLGPLARFSRGFCLGGPDSSEKFVWPCGHCRQILLEFSTPETTFQAITPNGTVAEACHFEQLLPNQFGLANLELTKLLTQDHRNFAYPYLETEVTDPKAINSLLPDLVPYRLASEYQTTGYDRAILECQNGALIPGVMLQNAAFLTLDPVMAALAIAVSRYGPNLTIKNIHLPLTEHTNSLLSDAEQRFTEQFSSSFGVIYHPQPNTS
jgi:cytidine deaminase